MAGTESGSPRRERRRKPREPLGSPLTITWERPDGCVQVVQATLADRSESGIRVVTRERLEPRSYVQVQMRQLGLAGTASVRYCQRHGMRFAAGLEFMGGMRWPESGSPPAGARG